MSTKKADVVSQKAFESTKAKPKANTTLRKSASASLPIRVNPTPTRSSIHPISTLTTAERYVLPRLRAALPTQSQKFQESWWVPRWGKGAQSGEIFIFGNGSVVCWGLDEDAAQKFVNKVISKPGIEVGKLEEVEKEDLEYVTDPTE